jgi:hypothetical protein
MCSNSPPCWHPHLFPVTKSKGTCKCQPKGTKSKEGDILDPKPKPKPKPRVKKPITSSSSDADTPGNEDNADEDSDLQEDASFCEHQVQIEQRKTDFLLAFEQRYRRVEKAKRPKIAVGSLLTAAAIEFIAEFGHLVFTGSHITTSNVGADLKGTLENSGLDTDAIRAIKNSHDECLEETQFIHLASHKCYLSLMRLIANQSVLSQCFL